MVNGSNYLDFEHVKAVMQNPPGKPTGTVISFQRWWKIIPLLESGKVYVPIEKSRSSDAMLVHRDEHDCVLLLAVAAKSGSQSIGPAILQTEVCVCARACSQVSDNILLLIEHTTDWEVCSPMC